MFAPAPVLVVPKRALLCPVNRVARFLTRSDLELATRLGVVSIPAKPGAHRKRGIPVGKAAGISWYASGDQLSQLIRCVRVLQRTRRVPLFQNGLCSLSVPTFTLMAGDPIFRDDFIAWREGRGGTGRPPLT